MDNRRHPLQGYFNAARRMPGISEDAVRAIVEQAPVSRKRRGAAFILAAMILALVIGAGALIRSSSTPADGSAGAGRALAAKRMQRAPAHGPAGHAAAEAPAQLHGVTGSSTAITQTQPTTHQTRISNNQEVGTMILHRSTRRILAASVAMMGAAVTALPAQTSGHLRTEKEIPAVIREMQTELGLATSDYWTSRLNDYKVRIDRMLSPGDLEHLNRLRVRFNVLAMQWLGNEMGGKEITPEEQKQKLDGLVEIYKTVKNMAGSYRADLDPVGRTVVGDLSEFLPEMNRRADNFVSMRRVDIDQAGYSQALTNARGKTDEVATLLNSGQGRMGVQMLYTMTLEPVVMLYDGTDLRTLWRQVEQFSSGGRTLALPAGAIAGYNIPETTALLPSSPNPGSSAVNIPYALTEPSERTLLRIYDAQGSLVASYDQGAQPQGDHTVQVNVSEFAPGTYLYHLAISTSKGERVYSRTMQVIR